MAQRTGKATHFPDGFACWREDLWYGVTHRTGHERNWRVRWKYTLRSARCGAGFHWPITFWDVASYYGPEEPRWACEFCGYERLPYRAWAWTPRWWWPPHWWYWLRSALSREEVS